LLDSITSKLSRDQLFYHEYPFLEHSQLVGFFTKKQLTYLEKETNKLLVLVENDNPIGYIACLRDDFDSENFGFDCYRIAELLVFTDDNEAIARTVSLLIAAVEDLAKTKTYYNIALSNNSKRFDRVFNSLTQCGYYYIHTLLTFSSQKRTFEEHSGKDGRVSIRVATPADTNDVARIAGGSFQFSRFHLDPYLDNTRASQLLSQSARNSIDKGFVDVMFVAEIENKVVGYYSAKKRFVKEFNLTIGDVVISAIDSNYRGYGVFSALDNRILNWLASNSDFAEMGTYLGNYPVHKTWINKGLGLVRGVHQLSKLVHS
jgi:GNAT superfamily N-acetyltransferase